MSVVVRGVKNAFRNGIRTGSIVVILAISIGLGLSMLLANQAVSKRIDDLKTKVGTTAIVNPAGSRDMQGGGEPLTNDNLAKVKTLAHVSSASASTSFTLRNSSASSDSGNFMMRGDGSQTVGDTNLQSSIDAGTLGRRFNVSSADGSTPSFTPPIRGVGISGNVDADGTALTITSGRALQSSDTYNAIVGKDLATKNNLSVGSTFTAFDKTFTVVGIYDQGTKFGNDSVAIPMATAQQLSGQSSQVSSIVVQADSIDNLQTVMTEIKNALGSNNVDVTSAQQNTQEAIDSLQSVQHISVIGFVMAVIAAAVVIFLTMLMIVRERRREIGVLKAIGGSNRTVVTQFIVEALVLVVMGAVVGLGFTLVSSNGIVGALVSGTTSSNSSSQTQDAGPGGARTFGGGGRQLRIVGGQRQNVGTLVQNVTATVGWTTLLYCLLSAIGIAIVGSAIPAWLIAKVRPAEVMRGE